jgi:hypothetical protein
MKKIFFKKIINLIYKYTKKKLKKIQFQGFVLGIWIINFGIKFQLGLKFAPYNVIFFLKFYC